MKILKLLAALLLLLSAGCQTTIAPDADPVVVKSQQALEISLAITDKFVAWERKNQKVVSPDVHSVAETLRKEFPPVFGIAMNLLKQYKLSRDPETKRLLNNYVLQVKNYSTLAQNAQ
jgi:hypothetical protein